MTDEEFLARLARLESDVARMVKRYLPIPLEPTAGNAQVTEAEVIEGQRTTAQAHPQQPDTLDQHIEERLVVSIG